jgi:PAS domain S-box-containing protein
MDPTERDQGRWTDLQRRAEELLDRDSGPDGEALDGDARELIQKLRVAQTELELQNEELRQAQESLEASRSRYQKLFHQAPMGYVVLDRIGMIAQVNEAFCQILGRTPDQLRRRSLRTVVVPDQQADFDRRLTAMLRRRDPRVIETRMSHGETDRIIEVRLEGSVVDEMPGAPADGGLLLAVSDVTESKTLEKQLWESQKLETVGRLAGGIAHDFNNALAVIQGTIDLARLDADLGEPLAEYCDQIESAAARAATLVQQLLAFARKSMVIPRVLDLAEVLAPTEIMLSRMLPESVRFDWSVAPELHRVRIDPVQIDQVLTNLVLNARDAVAGQGRIDVSCRNAELDERQCSGNLQALPGRYVAITVSDDGAGMDAETKAQIFEPFFTTKALGKGTGLGLATVYGIVAQNRGMVEVTSAVGEGSTFTVYLPCHDEAPTRADQPGKTPDRLRGDERVLLVEDDPQILHMIRQILSRKGYRVDAFDRPDQALSWFTDHGDAVQVVLSDVVMPDLSGPELVRQLLDHRPDLRFVFMSGYPRDEVTSPLLGDDGVLFLRKPFDSVTLLSAMRQVLDDSEQTSRA